MLPSKVRQKSLVVRATSPTLSGQSNTAAGTSSQSPAAVHPAGTPAKANTHSALASQQPATSTPQPYAAAAAAAITPRTPTSVSSPSSDDTLSYTIPEDVLANELDLLSTAQVQSGTSPTLSTCPATGGKLVNVPEERYQMLLALEQLFLKNAESHGRPGSSFARVEARVSSSGEPGAQSFHPENLDQLIMLASCSSTESKLVRDAKVELYKISRRAHEYTKMYCGMSNKIAKPIKAKVDEDRLKDFYQMSNAQVKILEAIIFEKHPAPNETAHNFSKKSLKQVSLAMACERVVAKDGPRDAHQPMQDVPQTGGVAQTAGTNHVLVPQAQISELQTLMQHTYDEVARLRQDNKRHRLAACHHKAPHHHQHQHHQQQSGGEEQSGLASETQDATDGGATFPAVIKCRPNKEMSPSAIRSLLAVHINPVEHNLQCTDIRTTSTGVVADFRLRSHCDDFVRLVNEHESINDVCTAAMGTFQHPTIELKNVPVEFTWEELCKRLTRENQPLDGYYSLLHSTKYKRAIKTTGTPTHQTWLFSVTPSMWHKLKSANLVVNLGWGPVVAREALYVRQCKLCLSYKHSTKNHPPADKKCFCVNCSEQYIKGESHSCQSSVRRCKHCIDHNARSRGKKANPTNTAHAADSSFCPLYQRKAQFLRRCIAYHPDQE